MSDLFLICADLTFPRGTFGRWGKAVVDLATTLGGMAGAAWTAGANTLRLRAALDADALRGVEESLIVAARLAARAGAAGELVIARNAQPIVDVRRLRVGQDETLVHLGARAAKSLSHHAGLAEARSAFVKS